MRRSNTNNPVQGFTVSHIETASNVLNTSEVLAFRVSSEASYYINDDSNNVATLVKGATTVIGDGVTSVTFSASTVVEVMKA